MRFLLVVLALCVSAHALINADFLAEVEATRQFEAFMTKHEIVYPNEQEKMMRFNIFKKTLRRIAELNALGESTHGINKFAAHTPEEFRRFHTGYRPQPADIKAGLLKTAHVATPKKDVNADVSSFDWRDKNAVSPVKDQGQCGSCWAFSATEEIESSYFLKHGTMPILAPQQIVSCDTVDAGCDGGDTITAYAYVEKKGLESEAAYPYTSGAEGVTGTCNYTAEDVVTKVLNYSYATPACTGACDKQNEELLATNLMSYGPVSICLNAGTDAWQTYTGGVMSTGCPHAYSDLDHCVQLVGFGTNTAGVKYWIVRNSWNTDWGVEGYIYLKYGQNTCGVADEATLVTTN